MKQFLTLMLIASRLSFCMAQNIVQVEYFIDTDKGFGKNSLQNTAPASDGSFPFTVNVSGIAPGLHRLYFRTKDNNNTWSNTARRNIEVLSGGTTATISGGEYFFDSDPGFGAAYSIAISPQDSIILQNFTAVSGALSPGIHKLYVRTKDTNGKWSITSRRNVEVLSTYAKRIITGGEYFFDSDPGFGLALPVTVMQQDSVILQNFVVATAALPTGYHKLYMRTKDNEGKWSLTVRRNVEMVRPSVSLISGAEYFFKTDSGFGNANPVAFATPAADGSFTFNIPLSKIPAGANTLYIRAKDSVNSNWSLTQWEKDSVITSSGADSLWSHPATWSNNKVPDANTVVILLNKVYVDITTAACKSLTPYRIDARCIVMQNMKITVTGHH